MINGGVDANKAEFAGLPVEGADLNKVGPSGRLTLNGTFTTDGGIDEILSIRLIIALFTNRYLLYV